MPPTNQSTPKASPKKERKRKALHPEQSRSISPPPDGAKSSPPSEKKQLDSHGEPRKVAELPRRSPDPTTSSTLRALQDFFETRMRTLEKGKGHTTSANSRTPGVFDRHLGEHLRLKRVVRIPAIADDLRAVADNAVQTFPADQLPLPHGSFPTTRRMRILRDFINRTVIQKELEIQKIYSGIAATCANVAATLAYPDPKGTWATTLLRWTDSPLETNAEGPPANQGQPDGFLNLDDITYTYTPRSIKKGKKEKEEKLPTSVRHLISHYGMKVLVLGEFKNLNFCDRDHLLHVVEQFCHGEFPWAGCLDGVKCCHKPSRVHYVGWDAEDHPCQSMRNARKQQKESEDKAIPCVDDEARNILQQAWASAVRYDATFIIIHAGNAEIIAIRDRKTQTFYLSDLINVDSCHNYLQMHVGLYIAAIRDAEERARMRSTQKEGPSWTPSKNDDGALDLTKKLDHEETKAELLNAASLRRYLRIIPKGNAFYHPFTRDLYRRIDSPDDIVLSRTPSPSQAPSPSPSFESSSEISDTLDKSTGSSNSGEISDTFDQSTGSSNSAETDNSMERYDATVIGLTEKTRFELHANLSDLSFFGQRTCRAALRFQDVKTHRSFLLSHFPIFVVKNASENTDIESLLEEYRVIEALRQKNVRHIPKTNWLFHCPNPNDPYKHFVALVLEDMGTSLAETMKSFKRGEGKRMKIQEAVSSQDAEEYEAILKSWHRAGYVHGNLSYKRLMIKVDTPGSSTKTLAIVGFRHAECVENLDSAARQASFDEDNRKLRRLVKFDATKSSTDNIGRIAETP
ncbi:hypothetical protein H0H93_006083 [Arthromyces matolae]|nr:hypothetical protein H0H93_006083 [Arthromyces matolae]